MFYIFVVPLIALGIFVAWLFVVDFIFYTKLNRELDRIHADYLAKRITEEERNQRVVDLFNRIQPMG